MTRARLLTAFMAAGVAASLSVETLAGGGYIITRSVVGGGSDGLTGVDHTLRGTTGQPGLGTAAGGGYALTGGFWMEGGASSAPIADDNFCSGGSNDGGACATHADCPGGACGLKSRYISIPTPSARGSEPQTIRVTVLDIDDALGLDAREGDVWWAGPPQLLPNPPLADLIGAPLLCQPTPTYAEVWPGGTLHLFGEPIVPGSTYEVHTCDASGANCSAPLIVATGKWGDVVPGFGGSGQPNFADITATVDKFKENPQAPDVSRTDMVPEIPNQVTNFADITAGVDAFKGAAYPLTIPACS
jgi:hypothetical protein